MTIRCHTETKYIVRHIVSCTHKVDQDTFKRQFKIYKEMKLKEDHAEGKKDTWKSREGKMKRK